MSNGNTTAFSTTIEHPRSSAIILGLLMKETHCQSTLLRRKRSFRVRSFGWTYPPHIFQPASMKMFGSIGAWEVLTREGIYTRTSQEDAWPLRSLTGRWR